MLIITNRFIKIYKSKNIKSLYIQWHQLNSVVNKDNEFGNVIQIDFYIMVFKFNGCVQQIKQFSKLF